MSDSLLVDALEAAETLASPVTGFLPTKAPLVDLPPPFLELSDACAQLPGRYHGQDYDCRPWLDQQFGRERPEWLHAASGADEHLRHNLMTKTSLLCHAYRWQGMPTPPENYQLKTIRLPPGLESLWAHLAERMMVPRVGIFYTMVANNWRLSGVEPGQAYDVEQLRDEAIDLVHSWLNPPLHEELRTFVSTALCIEARGAKILNHIQQACHCVLRQNAQEATYHLTFLAATILSINSIFNRGIKKARIHPDHFLRFVQPTMIWLLDHGDGPLEGASGPQACTFQLLDSFLGVPRQTALGEMIEQARRYMLPGHRALLEKFDRTGPVLREFVQQSDAPRLLEAYNRCLKLMQAWRTSHQKRGAMYLEGEAQHYVSTGLVVKDPVDRAEHFERTMEEHIVATRGQTLANPWEGHEHGLDYLFRFLTPSQREKLALKTEVFAMAAGETILAQGDLFPGLFSLKSGTAAVVKRIQAEERVVDRLQPHQIFGEMSLIENLPASASIVAEVDLEVVQVSLETVYDLINENREAEGDFYLALAQLLSHRLRNRFS
ncbi:MAG: cyclic nucleotide-binding domain-containing protein [Vulcanimicrobiota bacterium]